jgi:hypothetical protein
MNKKVKNKTVKNKKLIPNILENKSLNREIIKKNTINNIIDSLESVKPNLHKHSKQKKI